MSKLESDDLEIAPSLNRGEKIRVEILAFVFLLLAVCGAMGIFHFGVEVILALVIASLLFSASIVPRYVKSVRFGEVELEFRQFSSQQQDFINELQRRLTKLEGMVQVEETQDPLLLVERFEKAAHMFRTDDRASRVLAENEMVFTGIKLGREFLQNKLASGKLGERAGAAIALGTLGDSSVLDCLVQALNDNSSFVRYRVAKSIKKLAGTLSVEQAGKAVRALEGAMESEPNRPTREMMKSAIWALSKRMAGAQRRHPPRRYGGERSRRHN